MHASFSFLILPVDLQYAVLGFLARDLPSLLAFRNACKLTFALSQSMIAINISPDGKFNVTVDSLNKVLRSLYSPLDMVERANFTGCHVEDYDAIKLLPRTLSRLELRQNIPPMCLQLLPVHLESFTMSSNKWLLDPFVQFLPRGLKELNLSFCSNLTNQCLAWLPQGLKSLDISFCPHITSEGLRRLPSKIKTLRLLHAHEEMGAIDLLHLTSLETLYVTCVSHVILDGLHLPNSLRSLFLLDFAISCEDNMLPPGKKIFPSKLTDVLIPWSVKQADIDALPKTLRSLHLSSLQSIGSNISFRRLVSLETLSIGSGATDNHLRTLPYDLKSLHLRGCPAITDTAISRLSKKLLVSDFRSLMSYQEASNLA